MNFSPQKISSLVVVSIWLSVIVATQHPVTAQTIELRKGVTLDVSKAVMRDDHAVVDNRWIVATDKTGGDHPGWLYWILPDDFQAGQYRLTFTGLAQRYPSPWISIQDLEPYRIELRPPNRSTDTPVHCFTFADPADRAVNSPFQHHAYGKPLKMQRRISNRPLVLEPGMKLIIRMRYPQVMVGDVHLVPVEPWASPEVQVTAGQPHHMFEDQCPIRFDVKISNRSNQAWKGDLLIRWTDVNIGELASKQRAIELAPGKAQKLALTRELPFGAYQLDLRLDHSTGRTVTMQHKSFTMSPSIDAHELPEDWPFGFHKRPVEPAVPHVGIKWIRTFWGWDEMEPKAKGEYDWSEMDDLVALARKNGQYILWVCYTVPGWASRSPGKTFDMPADMRDFDDFLAAFWKRYAPGGKLDIIRAVEVWNEPNVNHMRHLSADDLVGFAARIKHSVDQHAPGAKVVGISESGGKHTAYVNRLLDAGMGDQIDVASLHIYEVGTPYGHVSIESKIKAMQQALRQHGHSMPLWNTESGLSQSIRHDTGTAWTQEQLNVLFSESPGFDPAQPHRLGKFWRSASERTGAANMVRSVAQQLSLGVEKVFWFRWQAGYWGWVQDWRSDGNPLPRLAVPVHAVMARNFADYGTQPLEPIAVASPEPAFDVHAYSFEGRRGRMIIAFVHPLSDEAAAGDNIGAEAQTNEANPNDSPAPDEQTHRWLRRKPMKPISVSLPVGTGAVQVMDMLGNTIGKEQNAAGRLAVGLTDEPVYILISK